MLLTIYQPQYFPRLHYFARICASDVFVILDSAQYTKSLVHLTQKGRERRKSYQSDTPIKYPQGEYFLTVPIKHDGLLPINKTQIDYSHKWVPKHLSTIKTFYSKAKNFENLFPQIKEVLTQKYDNLAELNIKIIIWALSSIFGLDFKVKDLTLENLNKNLEKGDLRLKKVIKDSQTGVRRPYGLQKGTEWTIAILKSQEASKYYYGGTALLGYMDIEAYKKAGITPLKQEWVCREYSQQFSDRVSFISNLSIIDLLFNEENDKVKEILLQ